MDLHFGCLPCSANDCGCDTRNASKDIAFIGVLFAPKLYSCFVVIVLSVTHAFFIAYRSNNLATIVIHVRVVEIAKSLRYLQVCFHGFTK